MAENTKNKDKDAQNKNANTENIRECSKTQGMEAKITQKTKYLN